MLTHWPKTVFHFVKRMYLHGERRFLKRPRTLCGPVRVKFNSGYVCNLRCPLCPTGRRVGKNCHELTLDDVRFLLSRVGDFRYVSLFGWGETFLNRDAFEIISLLKSKGKGVDVDSNLCIRKEEILEQIETCEIDLLSVSLDGVDQESYEQYRHGGSFDVVFENLKRMKSAPKGPKRIEWQYLVSKKNVEHVDEAKELARELGVDIRFFDIGMYLDIFYANSPELEREWRTDEQIERMRTFAKPGEVCHYMYNDPFIDPDGRVYPCCNAARAPKVLLDQGYENVFGDLQKNTLGEIWNNDHYQMMRCLFAGRQYDGSGVKPICLMCKVYLDSLRIATDNRPAFNDDGAKMDLST